MRRGIFIPYRWILVALVGLVTILWSVSNITAQPPIPHAVPPGIDMDCLSCHQAGVADAPRLALDHLGRANEDCQQCHAISGNLSIPIPHDIEGLEECHDCHLDGSGDAPRVAGVHASYTIDLCQNCHPHFEELEEPSVPGEEVEVETGTDEILQVSTLSGGAAGESCQQCHWQMAEQESHMGVVEVEAPAADQGATLFAEYCTSCHGEEGQVEAFSPDILELQLLAEDSEARLTPDEEEKLAGAVGVVINDAAYLGAHDDANVMQAIIGADSEAEFHAFASIYGGPLTWDDVVGLATYIRTWDTAGPPVQQPGFVPSFAENIYPIFEESCAGNCHLDKLKGDWSMENYEAVMTSGKNAPNIIPGDPENSLLAQKLLDRQEIGKRMPLKELLHPDQINMILDWIRAGAPNN